MADSSRVGIILLNWNQENDTSSCLASLREIDYPNYEIVLVDNGSSDGSPDRINTNFPEITLIRNGDNLGFAEGNNVGIRHLKGGRFDYVLLLNNDTEVERNFLTELVKVAEGREDVGVLGPKIYFFDDPEKIWFAGGYLNRLTGKTYHRGLSEEDRGQYDSISEVDFISGCAMLIKKRVLEELKGLDPDYFNSHEDVDFCLRARRAGHKLLYVPSSRIRHRFARAMGGRFSPFYIYYRVRNNLLLIKKNGFPWWQFAYSFAVNPVKMLAFTLLTGNFKGSYAVLRAMFDFLRGNYGRGKGF